jgi:nitroreductase/Pyruvate/2-oxoacid:ferredoxin oxidoreductase delta subunit
MPASVPTPARTFRTGIGDAPARPSVNYDTCTACGDCARVCGSGTLVMREGKLVVELERPEFIGCLGCGHCACVCPTGAVVVSGRRLAPEDLVPLPPRAARATPEALENLALARRSVREFTAEEVTAGEIKQIVRVAATAPMGIPPSDVGIVVVRGRARVQELAADLDRVFVGWARFFGSPVVRAFFRLVMKRANYEMLRDFVLPLARMLVEGRKHGKDWLFYDAPAVLLFHGAPGGDATDATIACTYAMLAAESLGLGSCMIGTVPPALARAPALKAKWGLLVENTPGLALILGRPAVEFRRAVRRKLASVKA